MIETDKIKFYENDIPNNLKFENSIAIDTETTGLHYYRDRLCLVQISAGDGIAHIVHFINTEYNCPNLKKLLTDEKILKIFQYARFDLAMLKQKLKVECKPAYCTKIASTIGRTNVQEHGLSHLCKDLLGVTILKEETHSDWGETNLTQKQLEYAAEDVLYLHQIKEKLDHILKRERRMELAQDCFKFLNARAELDRLGWVGVDIFAHKL